MRKNARLRAKESTIPVRAVLLGLGSLLIVLGLVSTRLSAHQVSPVVAKVEHSAKVEKKVVPAVVAQAAAPAVPAAPQVKFDFYNTLSTEKVTAAASSAPQKPAAGQYIDRIALFNGKDDASKLLQALQLKGFNAQVVELPSAANDGSVKYSVLVGPFSTEQEADVAQANLKAAGVGSSVKQET